MQKYWSSDLVFNFGSKRKHDPTFFTKYKNSPALPEPNVRRKLVERRGSKNSKQIQTYIKYHDPIKIKQVKEKQSQNPKKLFFNNTG